MLTKEQKRDAVEMFGPQEVEAVARLAGCRIPRPVFRLRDRGLYLRRYFLQQCAHYRRILDSDHQAPLHWHGHHGADDPQPCIGAVALPPARQHRLSELHVQWRWHTTGVEMIMDTELEYQQQRLNDFRDKAKVGRAAQRANRPDRPATADHRRLESPHGSSGLHRRDQGQRQGRHEFEIRVGRTQSNDRRITDAEAPPTKADHVRQLQDRDGRGVPGAGDGSPQVHRPTNLPWQEIVKQI